MKRYIASLALAILGLSGAQAHEGMWLPSLLEQVMGSMKEQGLELSAEDIYSVNNSSLTDAIVHFNGGCTASLISDKGLLLTNHHCGYSMIQQHSTLEDNYLEKGYWAGSGKEELTNPGVTASIVKYLRDVTNEVMDRLPDTLDGAISEKALRQAKQAVLDQVENPENYQLSIKDFDFGNQYILIAKEQFRDIRLVGAPPSSIGKFGADTDNWMWPRHTGDFSLFRIYTDGENQPADVAETNKPYRPERHLKINIGGIQPGDFTMVYGFPGSTRSYLPAAEVQNVKTEYNPARIAIRDSILETLDRRMRQDEEARLQYASKYARFSNSWKRWKGEIKGLNRVHAIDSIRAAEKAFTQLLQEDSSLADYRHKLAKLVHLYEKRLPVNMDRYYYLEIPYYGIETFRHMLRYRDLVAHYQEDRDSALAATAAKLSESMDGFYKNYDASLDEEVAQRILPMYWDSLHTGHLPELAQKYSGMSPEKHRKALARAYRKSPILPAEEWKALLRESPKKAAGQVAKSELYQLSTTLLSHYLEQIRPQITEYETQISEIQGDYTKGLREAYPDSALYPDANSSIRIGFGQVQPYLARDGVKYLTQTHLKGVVEKYQPGDYEFDVPQKLLELYEQKNYGPYGEDGKMPVCFIATNHTTGGNSGSPVLNSRGELIGLNFDRAWEGVMSDLYFEKSICRNISVDLRYVLFVVDKFAGADRLVQELDLTQERPAGK